MYVVTNTVRVQAEHAAHIERRFGGSAERMKQVTGCLGFMFLKDEAAGEPLVYIGLTQWEDEAAFTAWVASDAFRNAYSNQGDSGTSGEIHHYRVIAWPGWRHGYS
jgi:heme-degrading monooxygenase HmoA